MDLWRGSWGLVVGTKISFSMEPDETVAVTGACATCDPPKKAEWAIIGIPFDVKFCSDCVDYILFERAKARDRVRAKSEGDDDGEGEDFSY